MPDLQDWMIDTSTTLEVRGDTALDLWNATEAGESIAYFTMESGKTIAAKVVSKEPRFIDGEPALTIDLQRVKDRPSKK